MINVILQFLWLDLVNISLSAKFYQNIPNGLRVKFHFFSEFEPWQNLDQSQTSFDNLMGYIVSISIGNRRNFKRGLEMILGGGGGPNANERHHGP